MLRAQLRYFDVDRTVRRVMITSADVGEGKTMVSFNLARVAAGTDDRRALLIEADMRRPRMGKMIGREPGAGLAELLSHSQDVQGALRELVVSPDQMGDLDRPGGLDVLLAGSVPPNPIELLESDRMAELLNYADAIYDTVIIDTPPIGVVSDAIPLLHKVDGLLVISRMGTSRRDHALQLMKRLRGLNANILGVVVNSFHRESSGYGYYYYQDSDRAPAGEDRSPRRSIGQRTRSKPMG
jgi:capsular exopolysaccharide synthesis family protein